MATGPVESSPDRIRFNQREESTMNATKRISVLCTGLIAETAFARKGEVLFSYHGCVNCHGAEGKKPVSDVVPSIAGKPADRLFGKAKVILTGEGATQESQLMHAAFYSPAQCDAPPSDDDPRVITEWISIR
jgi:cytochrome c553